MPKPAIDEFRQALKSAMPALLAAGIFSGAINLLYLGSPLYLMQVYNRVLVSGSMPTLVMLTLALALALLAMAALDSIRARILVRGAMRMDRLLATRLLGALIDRGVMANGAMGAQALRDFDQFRMVMSGTSVHVLFDAPWTPLYLGLLFIIHPLLGATATLGVIALLALAALNDRATRAHLDPAQSAAVRAYTLTDSMVRHADLIRTMDMRLGLAGRWRGDRDLMLASQAQASDIAGSLTATIRFFRLMLQAVLIAVGAYLAVDHVILPATIFAASIITSRALAPVEHAVTAWRQFGSAGQAALRVRQLLAENPEAPARTHLPEPDGRVELDNVVFTPLGSRHPIIPGVSFSLAPGESLGIVGSSGAGKTTLARLMAGAVPPTSGKIKLGGVDLALWHSDDLGRHIGYLPDYVGLFAGTIRDNIARFSGVDDAAVVAAARRAKIHDMVLGFPDGYETVITDGGSELSGGQRQRIGLARAILGSPRLVILDEPNAHLDSAGERALDEVVADLQDSGITVVVVTHRPNVLALLDKLLVMSDGSVDMIGPRDEVVDSLRKKNVRPVAASAVGS